MLARKLQDVGFKEAGLAIDIGEVGDRVDDDRPNREMSGRLRVAPLPSTRLIAVALRDGTTQRLRISRSRFPLAVSDQDQPLAILRHPEPRGVEHAGRQNAVPGILEFLDQPSKQGFVAIAVRIDKASHALNVLHKEVARLENANHPQERERQLVARIVRATLPDCRKTLARDATDNEIEPSIPPSFGVLAHASMNRLLDRGFLKRGGVGAEHLAVREVVIVRRCVDGVVFDCGDHIESSLFGA